MRASRRHTLVLATALLIGVLAASAQAGGPPGKEVTAADFGGQQFDRAAIVDNRWLPLKPGTQLVYEGSALDEKRRVRRRLVTVVTDLTKLIGGVRTTVVWERDFREGRLVEAELAFFAQDGSGNVWNLGEYPEEYEDGKVVDNPAWIAGLKGAKAGIAMRAKPRLGSAAYSQGYAPPPVNWVDHAQVYRTGVRTCVPARCYADVLVTREFEPGKPDAYQLKYYAPGVGNVKVGWAGAKDENKETLRLVKAAHLSSAAVVAARSNALRLEEHGYRINRAVYGRTPPSRAR